MRRNGPGATSALAFRALVSRFGCSPGVQMALLHSFERWDGRGAPYGVSGEAIPLAARLATLGYVAVMFEAVAGGQAAIETVRRWSGRVIDPALARVFLEDPDDCLETASPDDPWAAVVAGEPGPTGGLPRSSGRDGNRVATLTWPRRAGATAAGGSRALLQFARSLHA